MKSNSSSPIIEKPINADDVSQLQNIILLFFAYRDFTGDADRQLKELGFGRAHHRVLFFVCRKPAMNVAELLKILGITKQSLARVLREMVGKDYIVQKPGPSDRRQRLLYPTKKGHDLILELSRLQSQRIAKAIKNSDIADAKQLSSFFSAMIDEDEYKMIEKLTQTP